MITGRDIESFKFYRSRNMREFLQENKFWSVVLQLSESLNLEKYSSLEFLNAIRKECVFTLNGPFSNVKINEGDYYSFDPEQRYDDDMWAHVFSLIALSCCSFDNLTTVQWVNLGLHDDFSVLLHIFGASVSRYASCNVSEMIRSFQNNPAFKLKYVFDFSALPEKPEKIPYKMLIIQYESIPHFEEEMKALICAYKDKYERELFYQMYSDIYRRFYGDGGPSKGMKALLAELEQLSKSEEELEEIVPLPPVQQEVAVAPAPPVEAAPQPAVPVDVSAYDTSVERCLRLALGDFFQSKVYKGMKFGKTHWRAVYEAYTEYAEPTFKDFARMLSTLFADKEKEWKLPDENNLSKALEKKQWKDGDKYNMVYKYMCAKMEEYYNMD